MELRHISIENFRLFDKNSIDNNTNFGEINIIYGLNGCGKTTFSTYLDYISKNNNDCEFIKSSFVINGGEFKKDGNKNLEKDKNKLFNKIRVFNRDFVDDNIRWNKDLNQILISSDDIKFSDTLKNLKIKEKDNLDNQIDLQKRMSSNDDILKQKAKEIKDNYFKELGVTSYSITNLRNDLSKQFSKPTEEEFKNAKDILSKNDFKKINDIKNDEIFMSDKDFLDIKEVLASDSILIRHIEELEDEKNEGAQEFAKLGLNLHKKLKNNKCFFCGSIIDESRIQELNKFFNDNFENFIKEIESKKEYIKSLINNIYSYENFFDLCELFPDQDLSNEFTKCKKEYKSVSKEYVNYLENINNLLDKKSKSIKFTNNISEFSNFKKFKQLIKDFNLNVVNKNNIFVDKLANEKEKSKIILKNYLIYDYKKYDNSHLKRSLEIKKQEENKLKKEIAEINLQIANSNIACKEMNNYLQYIIPNLFIKEEESIDDTTGEVSKIFKLIRKNNGSLAINLSEGEKTVIAFCYFIVSLDDRNYDKEKDIIVIDDPISSLDNNYIYNINVILSEKFLNNDGKNQFFLLTHNFYFFRKILATVKNCAKRGEKRFFEFRKYEGNIFVKKLRYKEDFILKYSSEYQMLIEKIVESDVESEPIFIANHIRRVLEIFLSFMVPDKNSTYERYNEIIKNNETVKKYRYLEIILNENSHTDELASLFCNSERNPSCYKNLKIEFYSFMLLVNREHSISLMNLNEDIKKKIYKDMREYYHLKYKSTVKS